jgi:hypothetical protein
MFRVGSKVYDPKTSRLVWEWDDTVVPPVYREYAKDGITVTLERPYNLKEMFVLNQSLLLIKATQALLDNKAFLDLAPPTQAQALNQIQALTKQVNALIRMATANVGAVDDT